MQLCTVHTDLSLAVIHIDLSPAVTHDDHGVLCREKAVGNRIVILAHIALSLNLLETEASLVVSLVACTLQFQASPKILKESFVFFGSLETTFAKTLLEVVHYEEL